MMAVIAESRQLFDAWIAAVTGAVDAAAGRLIRARTIRLDEGADGGFTASTVAATGGERLPAVSFRLDKGRPQPPLPAEWKAAFRGSRIEVQLQPDHVMTRLLDFPSKAGAFLDGMIRSQVDRLTPWSVNDAIFGWGAPETKANDRIEVAFAATSKAQVDPMLLMAKALDAASIAICAKAATGGGASSRITLLEKPLRSVIGPAVNLPRLLRTLLLSVLAAAAIALLANAYLGGSMQSELEDLQRRISQRRAALRLDANGGTSGLGLLAKRKQSTPASVMVLEAMSRVLPDSTYVTELRIEGDKVQVIGMTQDAPSLIRLIEQSPQFTRATFFAPTTHAPNESGERFHIEAHLTAYFGSGS
jgi:general secretion pathway protein L